MLDSLKGDRVALVAFAGSSVVKCPLTLDYGFMRMAVDDLSPTSVARGGTLIGDALRRVVGDVFDEDAEGFRDIILITDGEDHESFPVEAAMAAGDAGARIIAIGLGDEKVGRRVPVEDDYGRRRYLTYDGEEVVTRLDAETLRRVAAATTGGVYFNVATGNINLDEVYTGLILDAERRELEDVPDHRGDDQRVPEVRGNAEDRLLEDEVREHRIDAGDRVRLRDPEDDALDERRHTERDDERVDVPSHDDQAVGQADHAADEDREQRGEPDVPAVLDVEDRHEHRRQAERRRDREVEVADAQRQQQAEREDQQDGLRTQQARDVALGHEPIGREREEDDDGDPDADQREPLGFPLLLQADLAGRGRRRGGGGRHAATPA